MSEPKSLQQAILYFADPKNCREYLLARRWPDGVTCPRCESKNVLFLEKYNRWHCRDKHKAPQFTLKTGTIFEDSPIGLDKWLTAMWMLVNCKNGISSYELARDLGLSQKSAWFVLHRLRLAMRDTYFSKVGGPNNEVEVDESFIGGKMRNMHRDRRARFQAEKSAAKTAVIGILDRDTRQMRAKVVPDVKRETLQNEVLKHIQPFSRVYTDDAVGDDKLQEQFIHEVVNKTEAYVRGRVHVNGLENFWSLLLRGRASVSLQ